VVVLGHEAIGIDQLRSAYYIFNLLELFIIRTLNTKEFLTSVMIFVGSAC